MVSISKDTAERYENFSSFVVREARNAMGNPTILSALVLSAFTTFQRPNPKLLIEIPRAFNVGTRPEIAPSFSEKFRKDSSFFAEYDHITQTIHINAALVGMFENNPDREQLREGVKAVVFHEMVHHLDFIADGQFQDYEIVGGKKIRKPEVPERGWYFEELAFGKIKSRDF